MMYRWKIDEQKSDQKKHLLTFWSVIVIIINVLKRIFRGLDGGSMWLRLDDLIIAFRQNYK